MSDLIDRPVFSEGQILSAADLQSSQDHAGGQMARHERGLHLWGIAVGLALTKTEQTAVGGMKYVDVTLGAGMAIDGTGREIVVPSEQKLSETAFDQANVAAVGASPTDWYPVFLIGHDDPGTISIIGACGTTAGSRTAENFVIDFGRPGDAASLNDQTPPAPSEGPASGTWRVLVGFVQWNGTKFTDAGTSDTSTGTTIRYAGVSADSVAARAGTMTLSLPGGMPNGSFVFGVRGATGAVAPVLTVSATGDVTAAGKFVSSVPADGLPPGTIRVQSGVATDGVVLPLPDGVTDDMISKGTVALHVRLTPRVWAGAPPSNGPWIGSPVACEIDDTTRQLTCRLSWYRTQNVAGTPVIAPGSADYLIIVAAPAGGAP